MEMPDAPPTGESDSRQVSDADEARNNHIHDH